MNPHVLLRHTRCDGKAKVDLEYFIRNYPDPNRPCGKQN